MALLTELDPFAGLRGGLAKMAKQEGQWAGMPMPLDDLPLTMEPNFPNAELFESMGRTARERAEAQAQVPEGVKLRNSFWSRRWNTQIMIWEEPDGRICWGPGMPANDVDMQLNTLGASHAWGIEQEHRALQLLGTLVRHHTFKHYLLTGMFLEKSARSGLTYIFRKLRPTVALTDRAGGGAAWKTPRSGEGFYILAALCLHPIGYYQDSWAGAMCPTDDVIAHLQMMRGDEAMFWRRSNQHGPLRHEAGL